MVRTWGIICSVCTFVKEGRRETTNLVCIWWPSVAGIAAITSHKRRPDTNVFSSQSKRVTRAKDPFPILMILSFFLPLKKNLQRNYPSWKEFILPLVWWNYIAINNNFERLIWIHSKRTRDFVYQGWVGRISSHFTPLDRRMSIRKAKRTTNQKAAFRFTVILIGSRLSLLPNPCDLLER